MSKDYELSILGEASREGEVIVSADPSDEAQTDRLLNELRVITATRSEVKDAQLEIEGSNLLSDGKTSLDQSHLDLTPKPTAVNYAGLSVVHGRSLKMQTVVARDQGAVDWLEEFPDKKEKAA